MASRSVGDLLGKSIGNDLNMLAMGYVLILGYVCLNLGKMNSVEQRLFLSLMGVLSVGMGIISAYGLCQMIGRSNIFKGLNDVQ